MSKKSITDIDVKDKKVLVRVDFNVPQDDSGRITDENRIIGALPTIEYLMKAGAKVILCSHLGRPTSGYEPQLSLKPIAERLNELLGGKIMWSADIIGADAKAKIAALKDGEAVMLENVRFEPGEVRNDPAFAKELASFADIYVNDAFGAAHRPHASTSGVARYIKENVCGLLVQLELDFLDGALANPVRPLISIVGGAKVSDKIGVITNLLDKVDGIIIGGAMAYTFLKAQGGNVGASKVEDDKLDLAKELMDKAAKNGVKMYLPCDNVVTLDFAADADSRIAVSTGIPEGWQGMDIGPKTRENFAKVIKKAKTVIWNGPMGVFEFERFAVGTKAIAEALARNKGAVTIIGGGDSAAAIEQLGYADKVTHISTGGGACLEYLEGKELPGIVCLSDKPFTVNLNTAQKVKEFVGIIGKYPCGVNLKGGRFTVDAKSLLDVFSLDLSKHLTLEIHGCAYRDCDGCNGLVAELDKFIVK